MPAPKAAAQLSGPLFTAQRSTHRIHSSMRELVVRQTSRLFSGYAPAAVSPHLQQHWAGMSVRVLAPKEGSDGVEQRSQACVAGGWVPGQLLTA